MWKCIRKRAALLLTAAVLATILPFGIFARKEQADTKDIELKLTEVQGKTGQINIYTPNVEGNLKSIIFVNGQGGPKLNEYVPYIQQWMNDGYIKPMVVFMPFFDDTKMDIPGFSKKMDSLVTAIKNGTYESNIGKTIDKSELTVCGYSMGGGIAACSGCFFKDDFINVGVFSPSPQLHYSCGGKYYIENYCPFLYEYPGLDCKFSTASNKHLLLIGGSKEGDLTDGLEYGYNRYGKDQGFAKMVFDGDKESHGHPLFRKELFCFMYYIQNNDLPSDELIYQLFGKDYTIERIMPVKPDSPTPEQDQSILSGTVNVSGYYRCYQTLTAKAVNCPASDLNYQWKRNGANISGAVSSKYTLTKDDIDKNVVCVITDKDGKYSGSISSTETKVKKGFGPEVPKVTGVDCSYEGASDGKILNVSDLMEYAKGSQYGTYTDCKGDAITGLSKGTYFVRVKETETIAAGGIAIVTIGEKKGGLTPTDTNTPTPTNTVAPTDTNTPTPAESKDTTVTPLPDPTGSASKEATVTPTATAVVTAGATVSATPSATVSVTPGVPDSKVPSVTDGPEDSGISSPSDKNVLKAGGNSYLPDGKNSVIFRLANSLITDLNIPSTVKIGGKKYKVTAIAAGAFKGNKKIRSAVIGKNIRSIGANAFRNCKNLKKVVFKTVKLKKSTVGKNAFKGIAKKATFILPEKKFKNYKKFLPKTAKGTKITFKKR